MKTVEVLLREHVKDLGRCGDVVRVRAGFARNFLLPRRIAVAATADNKKMMLRRAERLDAEEAALNAEIDGLIARLEGLRLQTTQRADEHGHLYGSVSAAVIAELLRAAGHVVDVADVRLDGPLRTVGEHAVRIHVRAERNAEIVVVVDRLAE